MAGLGHEDQFPSPRPSDRCRCSQETFGRPSGNGRGAPIPAIGEPAIEPSRLRPDADIRPAHKSRKMHGQNRSQKRDGPYSVGKIRTGSNLG